MRVHLGVVVALLLAGAPPGRAQSSLSLAGTWRFRLDSNREGLAQRWFAAALPDRIAIPGTTDLAGYGPPAASASEGHLVREHVHIGPAFYQRDFEVPASWRSKHLELYLERVLWTSRVWIDGVATGTTQDSLTTPHRHRLGVLEPGSHVLTVCVDNSPHVNLGTMGHSYTEETQSIWNGLVGRVEIVAHDVVAIDRVQVFPAPARDEARVVVTVANRSARPTSGNVVVRLRRAARIVGEAAGDISCAPGFTDHELAVASREAVARWDEFSPELYEVEARLATRDCSDAANVSFGFRTLARDGRRLRVNGRAVFLRGNVECCVFPATGHPPTDLATWMHILQTGKDWGFNHFRFHSWCPPEAAFTAADRLGLYLQPETPTWVEGWMRERTPSRPADFGKDPAVVEFIRSELRRMTEAYGNHPSFCMLTIGNELGGADWRLAAGLVEEARARDPRRLYAVSTARKLTAADDYLVTHVTPGGPARGLGQPSTDWDLGAAVRAVAVPLIAHETGQRPVFPDYAGLDRYTGPLRPHNLLPFRDRLAERGMLDQNAAFVGASARWAVRQYRHEIEAFLRTEDYAGFQLLQLNDFPGQTEALVGLLDPFWQPKDDLAPVELAAVCAPTVPLLAFSRYVWEGGERFSARALVAHFGPQDLVGVTPRWSLADGAGETLAEGVLPTRDIVTGGRTRLGGLSLSLPAVTVPDRLRLQLAVGEAVHAWPLWIFPSEVPEAPANVLVAGSWDDATRRSLAEGKRVLLLPSAARNPRVFPGTFHSVYWSAVMFRQPHGTLGVVCDPHHPALAGFPQDGHSDWQWRTLLEGARFFVLDGAPPGYRPIVQPISDFHWSHKLGAVFETRFGKGRLLVCGLALAADDPAGRAMRASLLAYAASEAFAPVIELSPPLLDELLAEGGKPRDVPGAALNVSCARRLAELSRDIPWQAAADLVLVARDGYRVELVSGGTWRDDIGHAWHGQPLELVVHLPPAVRGTLRLHFSDWNALGRRGRVEMDGAGRDLGRHDGDGVWLEWPIDATQSGDGRLVVRARARAGPNVMVTQIVVVPD